MIDEPNYTELSERLKLLAHPGRLRILDVLRRDAECVCHLETLLQKPQPYISQQLSLLRKAGVITDEKQGQNVFYRLADGTMEEWLNLVLGPVDALPEAQAGGGTGNQSHVQVSACTCPKCDPGSNA